MNPIPSVKKFIKRIILQKKFPNSIIHAGASIDKLSIMGEHSVLFRNSTLIDSTLGAYSYIQSGSIICNADIGKFCSIAGNVYIGLASHPTHMVSTSPVFYDATQPLPKFFIDKQLFAEALVRTRIGADVWIGQGVMIKAGIKIGVGAVIGAGSVVTKDVAPYSICAGNPCKEIRLRFPEEIINSLILSMWWDKSEIDLILLANLFVEPSKLLIELSKTES